MELSDGERASAAIYILSMLVVVCPIAWLIAVSFGPYATLACVSWSAVIGWFWSSIYCWGRRQLKKLVRKQDEKEVKK